MNPYFRNRGAVAPSAESMTPEEKQFAEKVLGKVIRTERETLEWVAQFSERHAVELRDLREAEAAAKSQSPAEPFSAGAPPFGSEPDWESPWRFSTPKSLTEFESWNRALLHALSEVEAELRGSGLRPPAMPSSEIEEIWDSSKHPRLGASPNAGRFTSTGAGGRTRSPGDRTFAPPKSHDTSGHAKSKQSFEFDPGARMSQRSSSGVSDGPDQSTRKPSPFAASESDRAATKIANRSGNNWNGARILSLTDGFAPDWAPFIRNHFTLSVASSGAKEPTITVRSGESGPDINKNPLTPGALDGQATFHVEIPPDWNDFQVLQYVLGQIADNTDVHRLAVKWASGKPNLIEQIRDQRLRNGLPMAAALAGGYYTAIAGLTLGGQAAVAAWDIQNGDNLGAALGVACMLPLGKILEAGLKATGKIAIKAGEKLVAVLPAAVIERIGKLTADQRVFLGKKLLVAKSETEAAEIIERFLATPFDRHHPLAKFLSGNKDQLLATIPRELHQEFEVVLRRELKVAGLNTPVGTKMGTKEIWAKLFKDNAGSQGKAFDAVLKAAREIDAKHGTEITQRVWENIAGKNFTYIPGKKP